MKRIFALLFINLFVFYGYAYEKKKVNIAQELNEKSKLEFEYSFIEGMRYKLIGDYKNAINWFNNCLKILPSSPVVKFEIANILLANNNLDGSLSAARAAVDNNPTNIWYKILLANILQKKSMIEEASQIYADIISENPNREEFYLIQANLYASVEKWQKAIEVYNSYEKQYGITELVSIEKIKLYTKLDNLKKASNELMKLIHKFPDKNEYLGLLAELYFNYNQDEKGLQILDRLLKLDPENGFIHFYTADYYRSKKQFELADKHIKLALSSDKIDNEYKIQYIIKLLLSQDETKPTDTDLYYPYVNLLMEKYSDDLSVRAFHADFLKNNGKFQEAINELEYIISKDQSNYLTWEGLLLLYNEISDTVSMRVKSLETIKYFPEQPLPYTFVGITYIMESNFKQAIPFFEKGLELAEDKTFLKSQLYSYLGDSYYQIDSVQRAFKLFDMGLEMNPNDILILNNYAYYLSLRNENLGKAEQMISKAVSMDPINSTFLDTYAWVLYKRGDYSMSKYYIKLAIENSKESSGTLYEHYGDILYRSGDKEEAMKMWKKAMELGSEITNGLKKKIDTGVLSE